VIRGERTISKTGGEHQLNLNQITQWKQPAVKKLAFFNERALMRRPTRQAE